MEIDLSNQQVLEQLYKDSIPRTVVPNGGNWKPEVEALLQSASTEESRVVIRERCKRDLHYLNQHVLREPNSLELSELHEEMSEFISTPDKRKMVLIPRGHLKTTVCTVGRVCQLIMQNPEIRILIVNVKLDNAIGFLRKIKSHFETNEVFKWLNREILPDKGGKWTETEIIVKRKGAFQEATVEVIGVLGSLVSKHYDVIIYDDVVDGDNTATKEQIEKVLRWWRESLSLLEPYGEVQINGTRWHYNDLYGWILEHLGGEYKVYLRKAIEDGKPIWPTKFTLEYLDKLRKEQGSWVFACQYLLEPIDSDNAIFKKEWFKYYHEEDLRGKELRTYMTIDPAISLTKGSDNSAIVVCSMDEYNNMYVRATKFGRWLPKDLIDIIFDMNEMYQPVRIGLETAAFQKSLKYALQDEMRSRNLFLPLQELKFSGVNARTKEQRVQGLQPRFENGAVFFKQGMDDLEDELLRFPVGKHDDIVDALAYQLQLITVPRGDSDKNGKKRRHKRSGWTALNSLTGY